MHAKSVALLLALAAAVTSLPGCAHVPAYDRGRLAHPTMRPEYAESAGRGHMQGIQEGAAGGDTSATSGCGCN